MTADFVLDHDTVAHFLPDGSVILEATDRMLTLTKEALASLRASRPDLPPAGNPPEGAPVPKALEARGRFWSLGNVAYLQDEGGARYDLAHLFAELQGRKVWIMIEPEVG